MRANSILLVTCMLLAGTLLAETPGTSLATPLADRHGLPALEYEGDSPRVQVPLSPADSRRLMLVPEGYDVELFAAEPDIVNPIAMAWDERGRLFVACSLDYPHDLSPDEGGHDRIVICEDTDADGRADRFTPFAEGLSIVTSITFAGGGLLAAQAPYTLFLADTDGDDRADVRRVLFDGWGTGDTHAGPSSLRYGLDNWVWGAVGYSGFRHTFDDGPREHTMGVYRFTTDGRSFEPVGRFDNNTWGLGLSEDFEIFGSTANNNHSIHVGIPLRYHGDGGKPPLSPTIQGHYEVSPITTDVQQVDVRGGFTAAAGHNLYTARAYPESTWNRVALVNEPTAHLIHLARLVPDGAGFREEDAGNLMASADAWCAPVFSDVGPDSQVWFCDWYNPVLQHNPDGRKAPNQIWNAEAGPHNAHVNPRRDKTHGRIWRVVYRGDAEGDAGADPAPDGLSAEDPDACVAALGNGNMFWRTTAQRLLVERGQLDVVPLLVVDLLLGELGGNDLGLVHRLWCLHGLGALAGGQPEALDACLEALQHPNAAVRKAAVQVLPATHEVTAAVVESGILHDPEPRTRLAALLRASELPESKALADELLIAALDPRNRDDRWLEQAVRIATADRTARARDVLVPCAEVAPQRWRYRFAAPPEGWEQPGFDDSSWNVGESGFGRAGTPGARVGSQWHDSEIWMRREFELPELPAATDELSLRIHHDEDVEVYVNGALAADLDGYTVDYIDVPVTEAARAAVRSGANTLAIHCRQTWGGQYIDAGISVSRPPAAADEKGDGEASGVRELFLGVEVGTLLYDRDELHAIAGEPVELVFSNPDFMPHNFVLLQAGSLERFGAAVEEFVTDPMAGASHYVPDSDDVLAKATMVNHGETVRLRFTAPAEPGSYPYVCTFPGHWRLMQGALIVTAPVTPARVLIVGGNASHDFARWFGGEDGRTLARGGLAATTFTEDTAAIPESLARLDLLLLSNNKPIPEEARAPILDHVRAGGGLLIVHPATWYNWSDWPEYNRLLVGGGARSHEAYAEFDVEIVEPDHPALRGLPAGGFTITDELYRFEVDTTEGALPLQVLAVGRSRSTGEEFPVAWVATRERTRIAGTTLGHDGAAHRHPAYQLLLRNLATWILADRK